MESPKTLASIVASALGKLAKGKKKTLSQEQRQQRRQRMIDMNERRKP